MAGLHLHRDMPPEVALSAMRHCFDGDPGLPPGDKVMVLESGAYSGVGFQSFRFFG